MNVTGIVCEYNPFHAGHKFHINEAKSLTGADYTVAVMSGNFVQRGEPAIISKQARVRAALSEGIDLVLELPFPYACSSAQFFAEGAVSVLDSACVTNMAFGSESGDISKLSKAAADFQAKQIMIKKLISAGISYAKAVETITGIGKGDSNDMLGVEYIRALSKYGSNIKPFAVKRSSVSETGAEMPPASFIREKLVSSAANEKDFDKTCEKYLPPYSASVMLEEYMSGRCPVTFNAAEKIIFAAVRAGGPDRIASLPGVSEGLENRLYDAALDSDSADSLVSSCVSKRYTASRIKRILIHAAVTGAGKTYDFSKPVPYIRVLGMRKSAASLSSYITANSKVPYVMSNAEAKKICPELAEAEARAADIYSLCYPSGISSGRKEYTEKFIIV